MSFDRARIWLRRGTRCERGSTYFSPTHPFTHPLVHHPLIHSTTHPLINIHSSTRPTSLCSTNSFASFRLPADCPPPRYGSSCNLVLSTGQGVHGFTLDESLGEFILTHPDIQIPSRGKIYSFNEGNSLHFYPPTVKYLESIKYPANGKPYSARYIGSMVADVHRTLLYGGIFGYPDDKKSKDGECGGDRVTRRRGSAAVYTLSPTPVLSSTSFQQVKCRLALSTGTAWHLLSHPAARCAMCAVRRAMCDAGLPLTPLGKLRMLYEAFPMSFLTEQAGGVATTGTQRILDVIPKNIHGRCPVFLGSKEDVEDLKKFYDEYDGEKRW